MTFKAHIGPLEDTDNVTYVPPPEPTQDWANQMRMLSYRLSHAAQLYKQAQEARDRHIVIGRQHGYTTDRMGFYAGLGQSRISQIITAWWKRHPQKQG